MFLTYKLKSGQGYTKFKRRKLTETTLKAPGVYRETGLLGPSA